MSNFLEIYRGHIFKVAALSSIIHECSELYDTTAQSGFQESLVLGVFGFHFCSPIIIFPSYYFPQQCNKCRNPLLGSIGKSFLQPFKVLFSCSRWLWASIERNPWSKLVITGIVPPSGPFSMRYDGMLKDKLYPSTKEFLNWPFESYIIELGFL